MRPSFPTLASALSTLLLALTSVHVAAQDPAPGAGPLPPDAARRAQLVARADAAIVELQTTLLARLKDAMGKGGAPSAVAVCRDEAQQLTASIGGRHQLQIGRTSARVRNPLNAPRPWASALVASSAGARLADARPAVVDLEQGGVGVLRPIGTAEFCVTCHGPRDKVQATLGPALADAYPDDHALGFAPGDLRGWFWVEVR